MHPFDNCEIHTPKLACLSPFRDDIRQRLGWRPRRPVPHHLIELLQEFATHFRLAQV